MTVQFPPMPRLKRARIAAVMPILASPLARWQGWCRRLARQGADLLVLTSGNDGLGAGVALSTLGLHRADDQPSSAPMTMDAALKQTRRVVDRCLVAATEPLSSSTLTDVVMLNDPAHVSDWPGRLAGAQIYDFEQAQLAIELGCTFIVSDANDSALTQQLAGWSRHGASPIWFVRGCRNSQHLRTLIHSGVRRVWVEPEPWKGLPNWDVQLAAAWSTDQNLGDLAAINALFAKEA